MEVKMASYYVVTYYCLVPGWIAEDESWNGCYEEGCWALLPSGNASASLWISLHVVKNTFKIQK